MRSYSDDFGPFEGRVWLNTAHQGPMPKAAIEAALNAVANRRAPHRIEDSSFFEEPERLRRVLAKLISASPDDIILGNSTSFGLDLLANGIRWKDGDEVLLVRGDFPADVFPWLLLEDQGRIHVRIMEARGGAVQADEVAEAISRRTRLFCTSWVNSFNGAAIDEDAIGRVCRNAGVIFVLNASQGLGARVLDMGAAVVDAVTCCGYKWLCGPYGTGFCWLRPGLRESLIQRHGYWLAMQAGRSLDHMQGYSVRRDLGARGWDVFCTANFLNFAPWAAAVEYLLSSGPAAVAAYDGGLVTQFVRGIDLNQFELVSPVDGSERSTLVVLRPKTQSATEWRDRLGQAGIDAAVREGCLRISPHLHNTAADIDRTLETLRALNC